MAIQRSKVKEGTLHLGGATPMDFSCNPTNIRLTPTTDADDPVETLCGDIIAGESRTTWAMNGTSIADFDNEAGLIAFCFDNDGTNVGFTWQPSLNSPTYTGQVRVAAMEIGGDVNSSLTTDFSWALSDKPTVAYT